MSIFLNVNSRFLANAIHSAISKVIYVSPGVDEVIASALINAAKKIGVNNITVLLEFNKEIHKLGIL